MQTKYDWSNVPEEVQWIATDGDGVAHGFTSEPKPYATGLWAVNEEYTNYINVTEDLYDLFYEDWRDSLEQRPQVLNDFGFDFKQQPSNTVELGMQMLEEGVK